MKRKFNAETFKKESVMMYTLDHYTLLCNELGCAAGADFYTWHNFKMCIQGACAKRRGVLFHLHMPSVGACTKLRSASVYKLVPTMQASKYELPKHN